MHSIVRLRVKYINQFLHGYRKASLLSRDDEWVTRRHETKKMDRLHCRLVPVGPTFLIWPSTAYANRGTPTSMWRSPNEISYTVVVVECGNYMEACGAIATLFLNLKILVYCCFSTVNETQVGHIIETRSFKTNCKRFRDVVRREKNKNSKLCKRCVIVFENTILLLNYYSQHYTTSQTNA